MLRLARRIVNLVANEAREPAADTAGGLPLSANFAWTAVGNAVYAASLWGLLSVLAKLGSAEMVGEYVLALAVTAPVVMFMNLQLRAVQATDAEGEYSFADYLGLRIITASLAWVVIAAIALAMGHQGDTLLVILAVGLAKSIESVSDAFYGLLQQHERMDRVARSFMIRGPLSLVVLATAVHLTGRVFWGALGLAITWAAILLGYDVASGRLILRNARQVDHSTQDQAGGRALVRPRWQKRTLARLAWLALPLGFASMLVSLNANVPRYAVERFLGRRELGIFAAMVYLKTVGDLVVTALGRSASPRLARYYARGEGAAFGQLLLKLVAAGAALGAAAVVVAMVAGRQVLTLVYQPEFASHADVLVWLMGAAAIHYVSSFLAYGMTSARYLAVQFPLLVATAGTTALACLWLVPSLGLRGAAMALVLSAAVRTAGSMAVVVHSLRALGSRSE
jgi:O-antigen/teichoic acid export membrane protein